MCCLQNNRRVVGYTGYRNCQGFTSLQVLQPTACLYASMAFLVCQPCPYAVPLLLTEAACMATAQATACLQMKCSVCDESNLFAYPWNNTRAGDQGNASLPQPTLQCTAGQNYVDAASNPSANATLLNMTTATQGLVAYQSSIAPKPSECPASHAPAWLTSIELMAVLMWGCWRRAYYDGRHTRPCSLHRHGAPSSVAWQ